jgi:transcriptional regulator with XRE-family HTH domain
MALRRQRERLGLSLRDVSFQTGRAGELLPPSTLARIEQGKTEPGARRLFQLLALYELPAQYASDLVQLEDQAGPAPTLEKGETAVKKAIEAWKLGDFRAGLGLLLTLHDESASPAETLEHQKLALTFAIAARDLGKYRLARQILEDLMSGPLDETLVVPCLITSATVWRGLSAAIPAMAFVREAEARLGVKGAAQERAWVHHQKAKLMADAGKWDDVVTSIGLAKRAYRAAGDKYNRLRLDVLEMRRREACEGVDAALEFAASIQRHAEQLKAAHVALQVRLEIGRLLIAAKRPMDGIVVIEEVLSKAIALADQSTQFFAHFHLWKACELTGQLERSAVELNGACFRMRYVDEACPELREIRNIVKANGGVHERKRTKRRRTST